MVPSHHARAGKWEEGEGDRQGGMKVQDKMVGRRLGGSHQQKHTSDSVPDFLIQIPDFPVPDFPIQKSSLLICQKNSWTYR